MRETCPLVQGKFCKLWDRWTCLLYGLWPSKIVQINVHALFNDPFAHILYISIPRPDYGGVVSTIPRHNSLTRVTKSYLTGGGFAQYVRLYVVRTYTWLNVSKECRVTNYFGSCALRPPRRLCWFPLHPEQISPDITYSPLSLTATKIYTSTELAWR